MFVQTDTISEVIAHFIGYFEVRLDEARGRLSYEEFNHYAAKVVEGELPTIPTQMNQTLKLGLTPVSVKYVPPSEEMSQANGTLPHRIAHSSVFLPDQAWDHHAEPLPEFANLFFGTARPAPFFGSDPGGTILIANQHIQLHDDDIVILGSPDFVVQNSLDAEEMAGLTLDALAVASPLTDLEMPHEEADIGGFFTAASAAIAQMSDADPADGVAAFVGAESQGTFVDGQVADEAPDLLELLPVQLDANAQEPNPVDTTGQVVVTPDGISGSITLEAGANALVNEAVLVNAGLTTTFLAVLGDYHEINAIIQTNAYADRDTIDGAVPGRDGNDANSTLAHNVASMISGVQEDAADAAEAHPDIFPMNWQVTVIDGDLTFFQWIVQYNLTSDNDTHTLSSTGTTTNITTGQNIGIDQISFAQFGMNYDVIIIGGNLYDGNIICQTNVLYDNDSLSMLCETGADGTLSTSGNLLWNGADIRNIGATDWNDDVPDHYYEAADALDNQHYYMPSGFSHDDALEGFAGLRVLYISGNVYDLRYIEQVNVLGDADTLAIYEQELLKASDSEWSISTGSNALINSATIVDYDTTGDTAYIGGNTYSDAILIQADIIAAGSDNDLGGSGDALVNEVIAFLDYEDGSSFNDDMGASHVPTDGAPVDVMQSMLA